MILTTSLYGMNQKILTKKVVSKYQLIPILHLQVMHDCSIVYCVKISFVDENLCENALISQ